jgi:hypothetical protein
MKICLPVVFQPGCLSLILIFVHPGSRIWDPKTATKERVEKKFVVLPFLCHKNHKIENYINFELVEIKIWALKNRGLGSGIRKKPIPDPGSRGQKGTGSWIRIRNTDSNKILKQVGTVAKR